MTDKVALTNLSNLQNDATVVSAINANNAAITAGLNNTLSRDGTQPNTMNATLDMNSNPIVNLRSPIGSTEPLRKAELNTMLTQLESLLDHLAGTGNNTFINFYSNKASLQAANVDPSVLYVRVAGYTTAGDGGGALYVNRFGVLPAHPGYIRSNNGFYFEIVCNEVNVKTLGAIGDGATDDSTALNNARLVMLDSNQPNIMYVPAGTYILNSTGSLSFSDLSNKYTIRGDGPSSSIIKAKSSASLFTMSTCLSPMVLKDICFDGNKANTGTSNTCFMVSLVGDYSVVDNVEIKNSNNLGLVPAEKSVGVPVIGIVIKNSYIHDNETCGIFNVGAGGTTRLTIEDCYFENNYHTLSAMADSAGAFLTNSLYPQILRNTFVNNLNINGGQVLLGGGCTHGIISGNFIVQNISTGGENTAGIECECSDCTISNNTVVNSTNSGILVNGDLVHVLVVGNHVSSSNGGGIAFISSGGIFGVRESRIANNFIGFVKGHGSPGGSPGISLQAGGFTTVAITDNFIDSSNQTPLSGMANAWLVAGNTGFGLSTTVYLN